MEAQQTFEQLRQAITQAPVLALPYFSGSCVGVIKAGRSIVFFEKGLNNKFLYKSAYEKEMVALVLAVQHWRPYLLGGSFVVKTDHRSLKNLLS